MRNTLRLLPPLLLVLAIPIGALADEIRVERIEIIGKGLYRVETGETLPRTDTPGGTVAPAVKFTQIESTTAVPARIGVEFGLEYRIIGEPDGAEVTLEFVDTFPAPGLADPKKETPMRVARFELDKKIGKPVYSGYGFEEDWELVPGTWTFEIWHDGRKLAEESFTVIE